MRKYWGVLVALALLTPLGVVGAAAATPQVVPAEAPGTVVVMIAGYESTLTETDTYNPLTQTPTDVTEIEADFDPQNIDATYGATGCSATPDMTDSLQTAGAVVVPYSYAGATLSVVGGVPSMNVTTYPATAPSNVMPTDAAQTLDAEIASIHTVWPTSKVLVVGHSEGGLVAETWWASDFSPASYPEITGVFSLDSPINGVSQGNAIGGLFPGISAALVQYYEMAWANKQSDDAILLNKEQSEGGEYYVPGGTGGDGVYLVADKPALGNGLATPTVGLESQLLLDSSGGPSSLSMITSAQPPKVTHAVQVNQITASHECSMGNAGVITNITARVQTATVPSLPITPVPVVDQSGYRLVGSDGGIFTFGDAGFFGSHGGSPTNGAVAGMAATPDGQGYWLVTAQGTVYAYGEATSYGSLTGPLNKPIVGMAPTPDGGGYWLVASDGGVFAFGDATFEGSHGGTHLNQPVVAMAPTPDGGGYWLTASDGGIFTYGDATFHGSHGGSPLNKPVIAMAATPDGGGYWLTASDGGIFTYGDATFHGSHGGSPLNKPVIAMAATPDGGGYWLAASDGGIFTYGDATFEGSEGATVLNAPVVGLSTVAG